MKLLHAYPLIKKTVFLSFFLASCSNHPTKINPIETNKYSEANEINSLKFNELLNVEVDSSSKGVFLAEGSITELSQVKFGLVIPLSKFPVYSTELIAAADIAANYINSNGGINGRKLLVIRGDEGANSETAIEVVKTMANQYGIDALVGPIASFRALEVAKRIAIPKNIPMLATTASANVFSSLNDNDLIYRMIATNEVIANRITHYLKKLNKHQKVIIVSGKSLYSKELVNGINKYIQENNGEIINHLELSRLVDYSGIQLKSNIEKLAKSKAQSILLVLARDQAAELLVQMNKYWQGLLPHIITLDGVKPARLEQESLDNIEQCISMVITESINKTHTIFNDVSNLINQQSSIYDSAYVYDSVILFSLAHSIAELKEISVVKALQMLTGDGRRITADDYKNIKQLSAAFSEFSFYGASGQVRFDEQGNNLAAQLHLIPLSNSPDRLKNCGKTEAIQ